jgi:transposase
VQLVTADPDAARCPDCGQVSTSGKEWTLTRPRDLPVGGEPVLLQWRKRRWRCRTAECPRQSFTERVPEVPARARTTTRLRTRLATAVEDGRCQAEVAATFGVSWPTVQRAVVAYAARSASPSPPRSSGWTRPGSAAPAGSVARTAGGGTEPWETGFVDLAGGQGLLGQVDGRTTTAVRGWLAQRSPEFRDAIEVVVIDPHAGYARAVRELLPHARLAVDHFHLVLLANKAVTEVRQRVTRDRLHRRGRATDPPWANRRLLLRARERLSQRALARMWNGCIDHDPTGQILTAWIAKEELRALCALAARGGDPAEIRHRLWTFYAWCADARIPELTTLAKTIETWWPAVLVFLQTGLTNARTEGTNRLIKQVKRTACGFRNRTNYRRRVRLHCTRRSRRAPAGNQ